MEMIVFVGLPGSGKSGFYHRCFSSTHVRVNLDMLRTRRREAAIVDACLAHGQRLVIDNTNPRVEDRAPYLAKAMATHFAVDAYYFDVPFDLCRGRNLQREGRARIPDKGLKSVAGCMVRPRLSEGFRAIHVVDDAGRIMGVEAGE